jgi:hypothetical protein
LPDDGAGDCALTTHASTRVITAKMSFVFIGLLRLFSLGQCIHY